MPETVCGLMAGGVSVPLCGVRVDARLTGVAAEVTVVHRYRHHESVPVEAVYVFPLEEGAAVCGFRARVGARVVVGEVQERERAFATYDDAMAQGHGAFLLEQERPNVFTASVGNLRPGDEVEVAITYVAQLQREGSAVRFLVPTTIAPRYAPAAPPTVGQPDRERVSPPTWSEVPYGLSLSVAVAMASPLVAVECPSHPVRTRLEGRGAHVALVSDAVVMDRDFVLLVEEEAAQHPAALVATEPDGTRVVMLTVGPVAGLPPVAAQEVHFLLDCSGSMAGASISEARRALALCVRALSEGDHFNLWRFGSTYERLWPAPRPFTEATLAEAMRYIEASEASLGGTELLAPLQALAAMPLGSQAAAEPWWRRGRTPAAPTPASTRQLLLLTDGQLSNEGEVIALCRAQAATTRVFSFGIGAAASEYLVRGVARASRGAAEFVHPGERIEPKVLRLFNRITSPMLADVQVDWGGLEVEQAPAVTPPVFTGDTLTVFGRVRSGSATAVTLRAGDRAWPVPLALEAAEAGGPLPTLWARAAIRDLEEGEGARHGSNQGRGGAADRTTTRLIELGTRYGLLSRATSYVAVEQREPGAEATAPAVLRRVPVAFRGRLAAPPKPPRAPSWVPTEFPAFLRRDMTGDTPAPSPVPSPGSSRASSRANAAAPAAPPADRLFDLLLTQQADGSFRLTPALRAWLGARLAAVEAAARAQGEAAVATAVVLALLAREEGARRAEWEPAARKAQRWLDRQSTAVVVTGLV